MRKSFDYTKLSPEAQTSYDIWIYQTRTGGSRGALPDQRLHLRSDERGPCVPSAAADRLPSGRQRDGHGGVHQPDPRVRPGAAAADRDLEAQRHEGVRPPRFAFDFVIDESTKIITGAPFDETGPDSAVWADVKTKIADLQKKGALDDARAKAMLADARAALTGPFKAASTTADRVAERGPRQGAGEDLRRAARCRMARPTTTNGSPTRPRRP